MQNKCDQCEPDGRVEVLALDSLLNKKYKVLDDGFIRVVDYMGGDESIVQAARVSYGKGTRSLREDDQLIEYLMAHNHTSPFEMCEIKFHVRVPMDCWRQWIRHRTAGVNEYSTRFSEAINTVAVTDSRDWRIQNTQNKQGSEGRLLPGIGEHLTYQEKNLHQHQRVVYEERLEAGVAREQARKDLSLSTYTEAYWKMDLHNLFHFLQLRMDSHAQLEIRSYANIIGEIVSIWVPSAWRAFKRHRINALRLSEQEIYLLNALMNTGLDSLKQIVDGWGWFKNRKKSSRLVEFEDKLRRLGLMPETWEQLW